MARHHSPGCISGIHTGLLAAARTQGTGAPAGSLFVSCIFLGLLLWSLRLQSGLGNKPTALHLRQIS